MKIDIKELQETKIISSETAQKIESYYDNKPNSTYSRLLIVFGILGSVLISLGIILILAHNWDELPKSIKTLVAFFPLAIGQLACLYVILKKKSSLTWKEGSSTFLFLAIGTCISLISQIYNIPGHFGSFLLTWSLLGLPLVYIMRSSIASYLYIIGITYYTCYANFYNWEMNDYHYCWLILLIAPHYFQLSRQKFQSNFTTFHHWFFSFSLLVATFTFINDHDEIIFVSFMSLFGLFHLIGTRKEFQSIHAFANSYKILSSLGFLSVLLPLSYNWFWEDLIKHGIPSNELFTSSEFLSALVFSLIALTVLIRFNLNQENTSPISFLFLAFIPVFLIGTGTIISVYLVNLIILGMGIYYILSGANRDNLPLLNYGLIIIAALVLSRFFDDNISFVIRGVLFVLVGLSFFAGNYYVIKKRNRHE